jgi:hypothetical protein
MELSDEILHPLFSSLKDLTTTGSINSTFMAIARNDDKEEEEEIEEISNRTVHKKNKTRSSTRYSVMRPSERDEGRRQLREEILPFISSRTIIQTRRTQTSTSSKTNNTNNPIHNSKEQELKHDESLSSIELTALMKMWKG